MRGISPPDCAICAQPMASWEATYHAEWVHQGCSDHQVVLSGSVEERVKAISEALESLKNSIGVKT